MTTLEPEVEDKLRKVLMTVFDWTDLELLLVRHLMRGGNYANFKRPLRDLRQRLAKYDLEESNTHFRSTSQTWGNALMEKYPPIADMIMRATEENSRTDFEKDTFVPSYVA